MSEVVSPVSLTHYEILDVPRQASLDQVERAFRREITRYHPDTVYHLGRAFQQIASAKTVEVTQAYATLSDPVRRAAYDAWLEAGDGHDAERRMATRCSASSVVEDCAAPSRLAGRAAALEAVRRTASARFSRAIQQRFGVCEPMPVDGFDLACVPPKTRFFGPAPPRILLRCVLRVHREAIGDAWRAAATMRTEVRRDVSLFLAGPEVAGGRELAVAITEQRGKRMPGGAKLTLVPVNTDTWQAHVPTDAPPVVRQLLARVKSA